MQKILMIAATLSLLMAGCTDGGDSDDFTLDSGEGSGTMQLQVEDDATQAVEITLDGAWVKQAGVDEGGWVTVLEDETTWSFSGSGEPITGGGAIPAGAYDQIRIVFSGVTVDGEAALMSESGLELPLTIPVPVDGTSVLGLAFSWGEAVFSSSEGLAFAPVLASLRLVVDGESVADLEAEEIDQSAGKGPVARIRVFDDVGVQVFASDFVAADPERRLIGTAGDVTFSASASETLAPEAEVVSYAWDFGDGATGEGMTVIHPYSLEGGNFTAMLTVTDSNGNSDAQTIDLALVPPKVSKSFPFSGTAAGVLGLPADLQGSHGFEVDPLVGPDGTPALGITLVVGDLRPVGFAHPGSDLDLAVLDGANRNVGSGGGTANTAHFEKEYTIGDNQPTAGTWTATVKAGAAAPTDYQVTVDVTWQLGSDLDYLLWAQSYDDGHDHQH